MRFPTGLWAHDLTFACLAALVAPSRAQRAPCRWQSERTHRRWLLSGLSWPSPLPASAASHSSPLAMTEGLIRSAIGICRHLARR